MSFQSPLLKLDVSSDIKREESVINVFYRKPVGFNVELFTILLISFLGRILCQD